jgi:hypothetical protein
MKMRLTVLCLCLANATAFAQTAAEPGPASGNALPAASTQMRSVTPDLDRLQIASSQARLDLGRLRIDKWKADGESKRQAQSNADSLERNLTSALPGLIDAVRAAPQDLNANFKLYRNLNVLYDVFASLTESAGAFGPRSDYDALAQQLDTFDSVRRSLGDTLEQLTSSTQSELAQLRTQVRTYQQAATTAATPVKKVVVDDTVPTKRPVHKKKPVATSSSSPSDTSSAGASTPKP